MPYFNASGDLADNTNNIIGTIKRQSAEERERRNGGSGSRLAGSIRGAFRGGELDAGQMMAIDHAAADTAHKFALVEKVRGESERARKADELRSNPDAQSQFASDVAGTDTRTGRRIFGNLRNENEPWSAADASDAAITGGDAPTYPMAMPNVGPEIPKRMQDTLAALQAEQFGEGKSNAEQLMQAAGRAQEGRILATAAEAAKRGDVSQVNLNAAGVLGKKELTPFKTDTHGITTNEYTGGRDESGGMATASLNEVMAKASQAKAAAELSRVHAEDVRGKGGAGKPPPGYAWGAANAQGQPTLIAIEGGPANRTGTVAETGLSGEEFLKTLPPGVASNVKQVVAGSIPITAFSIRGGERERILALAGQYEPGFDLTNWKRRNETAAAFAKGMQGNAVRAVNQTLAHMGSLEKASIELNNPGGLLTLANPIVNLAQEHTGDPRQGVFRQKAMAVSSELRKVFSSGGVGNLEELRKWEETLPVNASRSQQRKYLLSGLDLLEGAIGALDDQYKRGMGPNASVMDIISPQAKATIGQLKAGAPADRRGAPRETSKRVVVDY